MISFRNAAPTMMRLLTVGLLTGCALALSPHAGADPVRVMPLGDSITDGYTTPGGYRIELWSDVLNNGLQINFVGSQSNGPASLGDHDHEGHPGWTISDIDGQVVGWLRTYAPQVVMLQIGTNDINRNVDPANAPARLSGLIDDICANLPPGGKLYVAQITPEADPNFNNQVISYNNQIPGIVQSKQNAGKPVFLVDMYDVLTPADLQDGVHPLPEGYAKMGDVWFNTIRTDLTGAGNSNEIVNGAYYSLTNAASGLNLDDTNWSTSAGTLMELWDAWGGAPQQWQLNLQPDGAYTLTSQVAGLNLDDPNGSNTWGQNLQLWPANGATAQEWRFAPQADGNYTLTNVAANLNLDDPNGAGPHGTLVQLWPGNGATAQEWTLTQH